MPTVPGAPTGVVATPGNSTASVAFTAPASNGGATITGYTITGTPGAGTVSGASSPIVATGLTNGVSYTFTVHATNSVGNSAESSPSTGVTPATVPGPPTGVTAAPGNQRATVSFTAPASNGGSPVTGYTVTAIDSTSSGRGGQTVSGANSPLVITGLTNADSYTFTVHATNTMGNSAESSATSAVVLAPTVPDPPINISGTSGVQQASISFSPPANNGGQAITSYTVTATDTIIPSNGGQHVSGTSSPITVPGLTAGDAYTFTVTATNSLGTSAASVSTGLIVPQLPQGAQVTPPPFANGSAYTVTKALNVTQLMDELTAAVGQQVQVALISNGSTPTIVDTTTSPSNPATLWVSPSTVSASVVIATINAHVPNPNYGQPAIVQAYLTVLQQVQSNSALDLTSSQIQTALKGLLVRVNQIQNGSLTPAG